MTQVIPITVSLDEPVRTFFGSQGTDTLISDTTYLIGFGFDGTACFRKGTRYGPDGLRAVSEDIESYSPYLDTDLEDYTFFDLGNLQLGDSTDVETQWQQATDDFNTLFDAASLRTNNIKMLTLGGEHSISYGPIVKYLEAYPDLVLLHLDAHADLRDGFEGYHFSHASIIRRVYDHFGENHQLIQYGIRSGTREEFVWMQENKTRALSRADFLQQVASIPKDRPIYLTLDLDYFDPSFMPGTGTPEPGGEDFHSFISLIKRLKERHFVGADVVELSPEIDPTGNSDVFAAKVVRELILALEGSRS